MPPWRLYRQTSSLSAALIVIASLVAALPARAGLVMSSKLLRPADIVGDEKVQ
jgi:hypothetical protein